MAELYWGCLLGGLLFTLVTVLFGDLIGNWLDGWFDFMSLEGHGALQPIVIIGGITAFGGAGVLLGKYTSLGGAATALFSLGFAFLLSIGVYFLYVKPMERSENSTGYSIGELAGKIGEVSIPIPPRGYGEVLVRVGGAGVTGQLAASFDGSLIEAGQRVVVVEIRDGTLFVSPLETV
ncbi:NfeD family protein [Paenibacillus sp. y28]|uniref:NfeD family protein n=1 Tax=Paenibacillus sp. y28 TaxID=3129110 RepID=UPI0030175174